MSKDPIKDTPDEIIARVLGRYLDPPSTMKTGMARATLVVDENVAFLVNPLEEANFHVFTPDKGMSDFNIKKKLLSHRILVTKNTKDFLADAPVLDYGIIGLDALPFVDPSAEYRTNETAKIISQAVSDFSLVAERTGFVIMLRPDGNHTFRRLG